MKTDIEIRRPKMNEPGKPGFLEQALGAQKIGQTLKQMKLKHESLTEQPKSPKGYATHKGDLY